jgi:hypothetical protein
MVSRKGDRMFSANSLRRRHYRFCLRRCDRRTPGSRSTAFGEFMGRIPIGMAQGAPAKAVRIGAKRIRGIVIPSCNGVHVRFVVQTPLAAIGG